MQLFFPAYIEIFSITFAERIPAVEDQIMAQQVLQNLEEIPRMIWDDDAPLCGTNLLLNRLILMIYFVVSEHSTRNANTLR